ncbi:MAG TPA: TIR domain-containing protein [Sphingomicrobium sp.]|nr:TIR domain-containing protein [Sphingomicrobium sp.]
MSGHDIFISYCREERPIARNFAECFAREGFSVWWDAQLHSGETFDEVIEKELRAAKAVVVLWSPRSVASRWVRAEATLADRVNKLVPIMIEACNRPIIFELTHAAELAEWTGDTSDPSWQTLVRDLRRLIDSGKETAPAVPAVVEQTSGSEMAQPEPAPSPPSPQTVDATDADGLMRALDRLSKAQESELAKPTSSEIERAEFYQRSDEFRRQEGDTVHCLLRLDGDETRYVVTPAGLSIGRSPPSDVIVSGMAVSRAHCLVELAADQLRVSDLNSTNGTYIDNDRIDRSAILAVGSVLRVGNVLFEHEVRSRAEMEQQGDLAGLGRDDSPPEIRVAR